MAQVIVVGAGIVGAASAYRLAEAGLKVLLLEKEATFAQGSTGRSAAGVRVQFSEPLNVLLSYHSILEYQRIPEAGYRPIGYLFLVPEALAEAQEEALRTQKALGVPVERLSLEEAREKVPFLEEGLAFATFGPMDGVIDPHGATAFYLKEARRLGAEVRFSEPLLGGERQGGLWRVETPKGRYEAPFLLLSTGAWTGEVGRRLGVEIPIWPVRRVVYATAPAPFPHAFPLTIDLGTGFYLRSEGERLLFGRSNPEEPPGFTEGVDWAWLGPTLEAGLARFPFLSELSLDRRASWWGYYEVTPDHNPILGFVAEGLLVAAGFSGHGVQQAAMVGRLMAEEVLLGRARSLDITPFGLERFLKGSLVGERGIV
ncbi:NAD(P)/FAD-dependent oxidoreductase [Thermus aquaticus]|uniref:FAD dependent oxidoreductase n=1 Tax=Thermus aquaticus (strain ATCC BAA-2747 / Y51MC23) TaxID=498848 RepID=A0ABN4IIA4_THEA5|nr:FAD-binding oxidoreductase [Thermus aquaticus]ALJ91343.1 FAD dependent oxidoreductase [Thermus aquaticus Y51MC23]